MQLSNQHPQIKICEASHFCIISELIAYKLNFLSEETGICVTKTARNVNFGNMKSEWEKNEFNIYKFMLKMYLLPLS